MLHQLRLAQGNCCFLRSLYFAGIRIFCWGAVVCKYLSLEPWRRCEKAETILCGRFIWMECMDIGLLTYSNKIALGQFWIPWCCLHTHQPSPRTTPTRRSVADTHWDWRLFGLVCFEILGSQLYGYYWPSKEIMLRLASFDWGWKVDKKLANLGSLPHGMERCL